MDLAKDTKEKMQSVIDHFKQELKNLRTGRASPSLLDGVMVESYGATLKLKDLATVNAPEARQLVISPYDMQNLQAIAKGIERANLNLRPIVDGNVVRINIPPMDEAARKEIAKIGKKKAEESKVAIREARRKSNDLARKMKSDGDLPEDAFKKMEKTIQELTDKCCEEIDALFAAKEKEILTV
jgi:ribosome recycling factor